MDDKHISPLLKNLKFLADRRLLDDDLDQALVNNVCSGITDPFVVSTINERAQHFRTQEFFRPPSPFLRPETNERDGDFLLGFDSAGQPIYVPFPMFSPPSISVATTRYRPGVTPTNSKRPARSEITL